MGLDDRRKMGSLYFSSRESGTPNIVMKEGILPLNLMSPGLHHNKQGHSWELMSKTMQNTNTTFSVKLNHEQTHSGEKSSFFVNIYYVVISFVHREDYHCVHISVIGSLP